MAYLPIKPVLYPIRRDILVGRLLDICYHGKLYDFAYPFYGK
jgi:hypothetical protein